MDKISDRRIFIMSNKNESSSDFIVKLVIFLGAVAAITVAVMLLLKKFGKNDELCEGDDGFCFDDEDFCDDYDCCCDCEDCAEKIEDAVENVVDDIKDEFKTEE